MATAARSVGKLPRFRGNCYTDRSRPGWIGFDDEAGAPGDVTARLWQHLSGRTGPSQFRNGLEHLVAGYAAEVTGHA